MSSLLQLSNNAIGRLSGNVLAGDLSLTLQTGEGALFPTLSGSQFFPATIIRASDGAYEIVKVTARSSDTLTITRAQEDTVALAFVAGDRVECRMTRDTVLKNLEPATATNLATSKTTPVDADEIPLVDSADSNLLKKLTWANLKSEIKSAVFSGWGALINGGTSKATPVDADAFAIMDSAASNATKKLTWANLKATAFSELGALIAAGTGKTTPVDADVLAIGDSAASNATKTLTWANLKATLKTYFDTLYGSTGHGQCRLVKSGSNLVLLPFNGNKLIINGTAQSVPAAGVSLAPPATTNTTYFIYAYMNAGTMTLEASTTGHATDSTTGVEIKSGDATRTLVGMARTVSSAWVDSQSQRFVLSYFNRRPVSAQKGLTSSTSTTSATFVELSSSDRAEFVCWAGSVHYNVTGAVSLNSGSTMQTAVWRDGAMLSPGISVSYGSAAGNQWPAVADSCLEESEGYHYGSIGASVSGQATWTGGGYSKVSAEFMG